MPSPECAVCGPVEIEVTLLKTCRYCDKQHCPEHMLPENHNCPGVKATNISHWIRHEDRFKELRQQVRGSLLGGSNDTTSKRERRHDATYSERDTLTDKGRSADRRNEGGSSSPNGGVGHPSSNAGAPVILGDDRSRFSRSLWTLIGYLLWPFLFLSGVLRAILAPFTSPGRLTILIFIVVVVGSQAIVTGAFSATDVIGSAGEPVDELAHEGTKYAGGLWANITNDSREPFKASTNTTTATAAGSGLDVQNQVTKAPTATDNGAISQAAVELEFLSAFNEWRAEQGLSEVTVDSQLTALGREHSEYMAEHGRLTHAEAGGRTVEARYRERGLLPECEIPIEGSDRYYPGAENAAQTWIYTNVVTDNGTAYYDSAKDLARGLLRQWINSPGHRRPMVQPAVDEIGLGIVITDENAVWASLEFC